MENVYRNWTVHHMIGHPVMGILIMFGLRKAAYWIHDVTLPEHSHDD